MKPGQTWGLLGGLALAGALAAPSCSTPAKGALMLAISTDMQTPKDVDVVSVYVATNGAPKFDYLGRVLPDGTLSLPSTLAVVEPDDPSAQVRIRVVAFKRQPSGDARARVVRDVLTTVPHQRTVLLRLPLSFLDDGSAEGTLPASLVPDAAHGVAEGDTSYLPTTAVATDPGYIRTSCDLTRGQTSVAGSCKDAAVASSALTPYADSAVFGDGGSASAPSCFPVDTCFAKSAPIPMASITTAPDGSCSFPLTASESGQDWNCALATTDGTGACVGGNCFVPLVSDPGAGFTIQAGKAIVMVPGVCKKLAAGAALYVDKKSCATKVEATPVCQPATAAAATDAGGASDATTGGNDATVSADGASPQDGQASTPDAGCAPLGPSGALPAGCPCAVAGDAGGDGGAPACGGACASRSCGPDVTGQLVCQPSSGCHMPGESCAKDGDCCGSAALAEASTPVTCVSGVCSQAVTCRPNGDYCKLATTSCNAACNCCSGNCSVMSTCRQDNAGVPRCTNPTCVSAGQACASSADCCNAAPCVPNASGNPPLVCFKSQCVPAAGPCSTGVDCCAGLTCSAGSCVVPAGPAADP